MSRYISNKQLLLLLVVIIFIIFALYYRFILIVQIEQLNILDQQIETQLQLLNIKEKEFSNIQKNNTNIKKNESDIKIFQEKIPQYVNTLEIITDISNAIKLYDIETKDIICKEIVPITLGENIIYESSFDLSIVGLYDDIIDFIEGLKKSNAIYNIKSINITTNDMNKKYFVKTNLAISTYALEQIIQSTSDLYNNNFWLNKKTYGLESLYYKINDNNSETVFSDKNKDIDNSVFKLNIGSMYSSKDTYSILGPNLSEENSYLQLQSDLPATIDIDINKYSYSYTLNSSDGKHQYYKNDINIDNPTIIIKSEILEIAQDKNISLDVFVKNDSGQTIKIKKTGSFLERINIYDDKGNIMVDNE